MDEYDEDLIRGVLNQLTADNLRMYLVSKSVVD